MSLSKMRLLVRLPEYSIFTQSNIHINYIVQILLGMNVILIIFKKKHQDFVAAYPTNKVIVEKIARNTSVNTKGQ